MGSALENQGVFQKITDCLKDPVILVDEKAHVSYWNQAAEKTFGYTREEAIGKGIHGLVVPKNMCKEGKERIEHSVKTFAETGVGYFTIGNVELVGRCKDGSEFPVELSISPLKLSGKWAAVGVVKDISKRKKDAEKMKDEEERYHALFNRAPSGVLIIDPETTCFVEFNDVAHKQLGYSREEFEKLCLSDIEGRESPSKIKSRIADILKVGGGEFETEHLTKDGAHKNMLVTIRTIKLKNKTFLHSIFHDITEIRKVEKALLESEAEYRQLVELAQEGVWVVDKNYVTTFVNPRMCQMLGCPQSEMVGKDIFQFLDSSFVADAKAFLSAYSEGLSGNFEFEFVKKDKSRIYTSIATSQITDDLGNKVGTLALLADITVRKQMENELEKYSKHLEELIQEKTSQLQLAQAQIIKSERLTAIGELAGMVGHDLRNPLSGIKNAAYYLEKKDSATLSDRSREMLSIISKCVDHSNKIVNDLLDYSREIRLERKDIILEALFSETLAMVQIPKKVKVKKRLSDTTKLSADMDKLKRVFVNLIKNAIDALPDGGTISLVSKEVNDKVEIIFSDNGTGIPEDILPKIFSPLFTTKAQGMGFGLAICKRIVEAHGGTIAVRSAKGKGTTFIVTLPLMLKEALEVKEIG